MTHPSTPAADAPRFAKVFCSQCGGEFGPGNSGFSHCESHTAKVDEGEKMPSLTEMRHEALAATREAALIAERDQLRAALVSIRDRLLACSEMPISAAEAFDSFYQSDVEQALALSAPAVGVE